MKSVLIYEKPMTDLIAKWRNSQFLMCASSVADNMMWKEDSSQHPSHLAMYTNHPFALIWQIIKRVMMSAGLTMILVTLLWLHREWFLDLLALMVDKPQKLPMVCDLLVQLHVRMFYQALHIVIIHTLKLFSSSSGGRAFWNRLQTWSQPVSGDPQHAFTSRKKGTSTIGVVVEVSYQARPLFTLCYYRKKNGSQYQPWYLAAPTMSFPLQVL